jgi:glutamyl-tRNA synthetase
MSLVRTRFAPSPTGFMHLGGLRTALYAYLFAKKHGGVFILRIEDTDRERYVEGAEKVIFDTLTQTGLHYDEGPGAGGNAGPYVQSERRNIYAHHAELLIERGFAYRCFCDKQTLEEQRTIHEASRVPHKYDGRCAKLSEEEAAAKQKAGNPCVIRQKVAPEGTTFFDDLVYGRIEVENTTLDDQVLIKGDGMPTYNFANVVDDHLMGITHIIRGNEFLSSTPKHRLLYQAFGWESPAYIHLPQVMRDATHKLSKRDGDAYFSDFTDKGYLVEAILNYIALLGWHPGGEREIFSLEELAEAFDIKGISKSPAIFDINKLNWLNGQYLRAKSPAEFHQTALPYIQKGVQSGIDTEFLASLLQPRCEQLSDIPEQLGFIDELPAYSADLYNNKKMKTDPNNAKEALEQTLPVLEGLNRWDQETIHGALFALIESLGIKNGRILYPLRVALSGMAFTPGGGVELCVLLGKEESVKRIGKAIKLLGEQTV